MGNCHAHSKRDEASYTLRIDYHDSHETRDQNQLLERALHYWIQALDLEKRLDIIEYSNKHE